MNTKPLKIGTRGSPLALLQTEMVEKALAARFPDILIEHVVIRTSGDWKPEQGEKRLSETEGGKGLFAREIEQALFDGAIDCAVHSLKDMPSFLPDGLALDHMLERADPRDAFISHKASSFTDLAQGAVVGTSSLRRQAFLLAKRPDLKIVPIRGNVHTRLGKLAEGQVDATYLAMAGLSRLGITGDFIHPVPVEAMLPACGQAVIAIETRIDGHETRALLDAIHNKDAGYTSAAERAALQVLDGSCHTPIGAYATMQDREMAFELAVASGDGTRFYSDKAQARIASVQEAETLGREIATRLKELVPSDIFI